MHVGVAPTVKSNVMSVLWFVDDVNDAIASVYGIGGKRSAPK